MPAVRPAALQPGDTIGVIAPGEYARNRSEMQVGRELLQQHGFNVLFGQHVGDRYGYLAGSDRARADDFNAMWADPQVKAIVCWGAVWGAARILPYIDFDVVRANPKLFVGCGNTTAIHLAAARQTDFITIHGPGFEAFYRSPYTLRAFWDALTSNGPCGDIGQPPTRHETAFEYPPLVSYVPGTASGTLIGGNLAAVAASLGTPDEIDTEGRILLLEARDLPPYTVERHLTALWLAGKLQAAAGIVVGECVNCLCAPDETNTFSLEDVLENRFLRLPVPCLYGLRLGQGKDTTPVPIGARATLDSSGRSLRIEGLTN